MSNREYHVINNARIEPPRYRGRQNWEPTFIKPNVFALRRSKGVDVDTNPDKDGHLPIWCWGVARASF